MLATFLDSSTTSFSTYPDGLSTSFKKLETNRTNKHQVLGCQTFTSFILENWFCCFFFEGEKAKNTEKLWSQQKSSDRSFKCSNNTRGSQCILISSSTFLNLRFWIMFVKFFTTIFLSSSSTHRNTFFINFFLRLIFDQKMPFKDFCFLGLSQCLKLKLDSVEFAEHWSSSAATSLIKYFSFSSLPYVRLGFRPKISFVDARRCVNNPVPSQFTKLSARNIFSLHSIDIF